MGWHILSAMPLAKKKSAGNRRKPADAVVGTLELGDSAVLQAGAGGKYRRGIRFEPQHDLPDLGPGDLIATGTPPRIGSAMMPEPLFLKAGDLLRLGSRKLGVPEHRVHAWRSL